MDKKKCSDCNKTFTIDKFTKCGKKFRKKTQIWVQTYRPQCLKCWVIRESKRIGAIKKKKKKGDQ